AFQASEVYETEDIHSSLRRAAFLTVALPLTSETRGLIREDEFALMKRTASIVIVSRAAVVDEEALYRALVERRISYAAIDTWYSSPPSAPSRYSIEKLHNVIATPHIG